MHFPREKKHIQTVSLSRLFFLVFFFIPLNPNSQLPGYSRLMAVQCTREYFRWSTVPRSVDPPLWMKRNRRPPLPPVPGRAGPASGDVSSPTSLFPASAGTICVRDLQLFQKVLKVSNFLCLLERYKKIENLVLCSADFFIM